MQDQLWTAGPAKRSRGPVYQGVAKQIRGLIAAGRLDKDLMAGTISQARALADSIDLASGHDGGKPEYGTSLAAMHHQLDELLDRLGGQALEADPFEDLLGKLGAPSTP